MSAVNAAGGVYRNPPYILGPQIFMAAEWKDIVDWGLDIHNIPDHWDTKGEDILVGVADTGRPNHPDLGNAIVLSQNFSSSHTDEDHQGHSTHVCGTIAARANDKGVVGVAPKCKIAIAKVLGDDGSGSNLSVANGIRYLHQQGCNIINMSLGGGFDVTIANVVKAAVDDGVKVICAAGNDGSIAGRNTVNYPAKLPNTVAIASYNKAGNLSQFSSRGKEVHMAFPGEDILSCWLGAKYRRISGTSMATPFCAGLVALLLSANAKARREGKEVLHPIRDNVDLFRHLKSTSVDKGPSGHDIGWGWGVVDTEKFLTIYGNDDNGDDPGNDGPVDGEISFDLFGFVKFRYPVKIRDEEGLFISI